MTKEKAGVVCDGHYHRRPTKDHSDKLADIIWWIKGALDTRAIDVSFDDSHIEALVVHRKYAQFNQSGDHYDCSS